MKRLSPLAWTSLAAVLSSPALALASPPDARTTTPPLLASDEPSVSHLVRGGAYLYWARDHELVRMPTAGGKAEVLWSTRKYIVDLTLRGDSVFALLKNDRESLDAGDLVHLALGRRVVARSVPGGGDRSEKDMIATDGKQVFWATHGASPRGTVNRGAVASQRPTRLYTSDGPVPAALAVDGADLYYFVDHELYRAPVAGGAAVVVQKLPDLVRRMAFDEGHIYLAVRRLTAPDHVSFDVDVIPRAGGQVQRLATGEGRICDLAVDGASVYWTDMDERTVKRVGKRGGVPSVLARDPHQPCWLALDETRLYWSSSGNGIATVSSLPR